MIQSRELECGLVINHDGIIIRVFKPGETVAEMLSESALFLTDSIAPLSSAEATTVFITSLDRVHWSYFYYHADAKMLYFPMLTKQELMTLREEAFKDTKDEAIALQQFDLAGGNARFVFSPLFCTVDETKAEIVKSVLLVPSDLLYWAAAHYAIRFKTKGEVAEEEYAEDPDAFPDGPALQPHQEEYYHLHGLLPVSEFVTDLLLRLLMELYEHMAVAFLQSTVDIGEAATLRTHLFAAYSLRVLRSGIDLRWRLLTYDARDRDGAADGLSLSRSGLLAFPRRPTGRIGFNGMEGLRRALSSETSVAAATVASVAFDDPPAGSVDATDLASVVPAGSITNQLVSANKREYAVDAVLPLPIKITNAGGTALPQPFPLVCGLPVNFTCGESHEINAASAARSKQTNAVSGLKAVLGALCGGRLPSNQPLPLLWAVPATVFPSFPAQVTEPKSFTMDTGN